MLVDGLSLDDHLTSNARSGVSLESVKEFIALSNSFSAEYGHAAGAVISVLTRSGINEPAGRVFYYHRDDAWNATSAAARLTNPPDEKSRLEQQILGGFFGGAVVRNRAFFGSVEHTRRQREYRDVWRSAGVPARRAHAPSGAASQASVLLEAISSSARRTR